jgi:hypothetical protein
MNAVNNDIHCEIKNRLIVGNVCDHADKYLFLYHLSENLRIEVSYECKNIHVYLGYVTEHRGKYWYLRNRE